MVHNVADHEEVRREEVRREGMGDMEPFLKHLSMVALFRSASELSRFTMR